jgi:gamma-glutamylcyclotransferase (GGCT)/AIG2-like uncharacterized protein YtfP
MSKIFVYGTLLSGLQRSSVLENETFLGIGTISATLYDLGAFPGIKEGDDQVHGELYEIDDDVLFLLDTIEGYDEFDHDRSLYVRKVVDVTTDDGVTESAFVYYYNNGDIPHNQKIPEGDYRFYLATKGTFL